MNNSSDVATLDDEDWTDVTGPQFHDVQTVTPQIYLDSFITCIGYNKSKCIFFRNKIMLKNKISKNPELIKEIGVKLIIYQFRTQGSNNNKFICQSRI